MFQSLGRFFTALGLGVWLGGIAFAGACAPVLFRVARASNVEAVAPQQFGEMLSRFQFIALACAAFALAGWFLDRPRRGSRPHLWRTQGALTLLMLGVTLWMATQLFPRMTTAQRAFLPQFQTAQSETPRALKLPPKSVGGAARREFDALHTLSTRLTMSVFWMGVVALGCFALRGGELQRVTSRISEREAELASA